MKRHLPFVITVLGIFLLLLAVGKMRATGEYPELAKKPGVDTTGPPPVRETFNLAFKVKGHSFGLIEVSIFYDEDAPAPEFTSLLLYGDSYHGEPRRLYSRLFMELTSRYLTYEEVIWPMLLILTALPLTLLYLLRRPLLRALTFRRRRTSLPAD